MVTIVLLAGASGSGKSTLANCVVDFLNNNRDVVLFQQDSYFTTPYLPYGQRQDASYEDGSGIDWEKLRKDVESSIQTSKASEVILLVEGHMLGAASSTVFFEAFDGKASIIIVCIQCSQNICKNRRLNRRERSKEEWEELSMYIDKYVWPSFHKFGLPAMDSLRNCAKENPERCIQMLELSAEIDDSLELNARKIVGTIQQTMEAGTQSTTEDEITEEWPCISDNLQGFAKHHQITTRLDHTEDASFELECVSSLTPLDMVHLSLGTHDATGSSVWMGAYNLIEALASNATVKSQSDPDELSLRMCFHSKRVLELGCGTGVAGLSLLLSPNSWSAKASHVCFTDNDDAVLALCRRNCEQNELLLPDDARCSFVNLNWGTLPEGNGNHSLFDTVLATDVLYDLACLDVLLFTTDGILRPSGIFVLAHVPRSCLPESQFTKANSDGDYNASLEDYIVKTARDCGLRMLAIIRPSHIRSAQGDDNSLVPLNESSLLEMEEAGAAILVFEKEALPEASR